MKLYPTHTPGRPWAPHSLCSWGSCTCSKRISMLQGTHLCVSSNFEQCQCRGSQPYVSVYPHHLLSVWMWLAKDGRKHGRKPRAHCMAALSGGMKTERFHLIFFFFLRHTPAKFSPMHSSSQAKRTLFQTTVSTDISRLLLCLKWHLDRRRGMVARGQGGQQNPQKSPE